MSDWESLSGDLQELVIESLRLEGDDGLVYRLVSKRWSELVRDSIVRRACPKHMDAFFDSQLMRIESRKALLRYFCQCSRPMSVWCHSYIAIRDAKQCTHLNKNGWTQCRRKYSSPHTKLCPIHDKKVRALFSQKNAFV